jgi:hypothetical protein
MPLLNILICYVFLRKNTPRPLTVGRHPLAVAVLIDFFKKDDRHIGVSSHGDLQDFPVGAEEDCR